MPAGVLPTHNSAAFKGTVNGCATLTAAFLASLRNAAMLAVNKDHAFVLMLPESLLLKFSADTYHISMYLIMYLVSDNLIFAEALSRGCFLFFYTPARLSLLVADLLDTGCMVTSQHDTSVAARDSVNTAMLKLTAAQRGITVACVRSVAPPASAPWLNQVTLGQLCKGGTNRGHSDFLQLLPDAFVAGHQGDDFDVSVELLLPNNAVGAGISNKLKAVRATSHVLNTSASGLFATFIGEGDAHCELERRGASTDEERFTPLFERAHRAAFVHISAAFPNATPREAQSLAEELAVHFKLASGTALARMSAVNTSVRPLLADLDAACAPDKPARDRLLSILKRSNEWVVSKSDASSSAEGHSTAENLQLLMATSTYPSLLNKLTAMADSPTLEVIKVCATHASAVGLLFLNNAKVSQFKAIRSLAAASDKSYLHGYFCGVMQFDGEGVHDPEVQHLFPFVANASLKTDAQYANSTNLLMGRFPLLDLFGLAHPWVLKYESITDLQPLPLPLQAWLSRQHMDRYEKPIAMLMSAIGLDQSRSVQGSFREFYAHAANRAKQMSLLPPGIMATAQLFTRILEAYKLVFTQFASAMANMYAQQTHIAARPHFLEPASPAVLLLSTIDDDISEVKKVAKQMERGMAAVQRPDMQSLPAPPNWQAPPAPPNWQAPPTWSPHLAKHKPYPPGEVKTYPASAGQWATSASLLPGGIATSPGWLIENPAQPVHELDYWKRPSAFGPEIFSGWGDAAYQHGVAMTDAGPVFGKKCVVSETSSDIPGNTCIASCVPAWSNEEKAKWCVKLGCTDHEYPKDKGKEDFKFIDVPAGTDQSKWKWIVHPHKDVRREGEGEGEGLAEECAHGGQKVPRACRAAGCQAGGHRCK